MGRVRGNNQDGLDRLMGLLGKGIEKKIKIDEGQETLAKINLICSTGVNT